jgi:2-keto-4-pentenoate hydratase/2-oxohepta-3-ene-1,7-dioic acid hydratase in catechol pathway
MRLVSYDAGDGARAGVLEDDRVVDAWALLGEPHRGGLRELLAAGRLDDLRGRLGDSGAPSHPLAAVALLAPIPDPDKIVCIGLNYRAHVSEGGGKTAEFPSLFTRFTDTLVGHGGAIIRPLVSSELDYECELALVIGKPGRHIRRADAMSHVAGYSCFNDASVRDYQVSHSLPAGKNFFATGGFGPWIVTSDEISEPGKLGLRTVLNGVEVQHGNTADLIFDIPAIISYVSGFTPLAPGDIISTGTPEGVGFLRKPPIWLKPGDVIEIEVEKIGTLRNPVVAEKA